MRPRLVALLVAAALTTGWLLASILSPPVAELQTLPDRVDSRAAAREAHAETQFTEQLRLKLQSPPAVPVTRRNPFVFGEPRRVPRESARTTVVAPAAEPIADLPVATGPSLRLSGIGFTATENGPVGTAVIVDGSTVHLVKVGERVAGYSVIAIGEESVTVQNAAGVEWVLRLK